MHRTGGRPKRSGTAMSGMSSDGLGVGPDSGQAPANSGSVVGRKTDSVRTAEH